MGRHEKIRHLKENEILVLRPLHRDEADEMLRLMVWLDGLETGMGGGFLPGRDLLWKIYRNGEIKDKDG